MKTKNGKNENKARYAIFGARKHAPQKSLARLSKTIKKHSVDFPAERVVLFLGVIERAVRRPLIPKLRDVKVVHLKNTVYENHKLTCIFEKCVCVLRKPKIHLFLREMCTSSHSFSSSVRNSHGLNESGEAPHDWSLLRKRRRGLRQGLLILCAKIQLDKYLS